MVAIRLEGIRKTYGEVEVLKGVDFEARHGEFVVFVGPSGCGKSTLLRMIAGLELPDSGEVYFGDERYTNVAPARRDVGMVFQSYALYPHMTVAENMTMSLRLAGVARQKRRERATEAARMLQLDGLLDRRPAELSGGQRQRVAIGRAIIRSPKVFLFDEPLSNLDAALRVETRIGITKLHHSFDTTMIYVTHDQTEAMTMADRIVILDDGRIAQVGTPLELYRRPANRFVAGFLGSPKMNFVEVRETGRDGSTVALDLEGGGRIGIELAAADAPSPTVLGIRPENLDVADDGELTGRVLAVEQLGSETLVHLDSGTDTVIARMEQDFAASVGAPLTMRIAPAAAHLFGADEASIATRQANG